MNHIFKFGFVAKHVSGGEGMDDHARITELVLEDNLYIWQSITV